MSTERPSHESDADGWCAEATVGNIATPAAASAVIDATRLTVFTRRLLCLITARCVVPRAARYQSSSVRIRRAVITHWGESSRPQQFYSTAAEIASATKLL